MNWNSTKNPPPEPVPAGSDASVASPRAKAELVEAFAHHVPRHSHSLGLMQLFLQLVLRAATGLRGAAGALNVLSQLFPVAEAAPSPNGGQMWLLRLGLYELLRPKEQADDWAWIIDHTIQIGPSKCFLVVGVRLSDWEAKRAKPETSAALEHEDLSAWMIEPVQKSDGATVARQLRELSRQTGVVPRQLLSDGGADVQKGIKQFCASHPQTAGRKDLVHAAANLVKHELNADANWAAFLRDASQAKAKLRQTQFAFLLPPELKAKARWMNLDALLNWSRKAATFVASPHPVPGASLAGEALERQLGWLRRYEEPLAAWAKMLAAVAASLKYIREHGYHPDAQRELQTELATFTADQPSPASRVTTGLLRFVAEQSSDLSGGQRLLGSSEVLESLIGKAKQLEGQQSRSGFTKMILGTAASVAKLTDRTVQTALEAVKVRDVTQWVQTHIGISVQGQRTHAFTTTTAEHNWDKLQPTTS
jgi:hypothetical protein